jgi:hypothetical protein
MNRRTLGKYMVGFVYSVVLVGSIAVGVPLLWLVTLEIWRQSGPFLWVGIVVAILVAIAFTGHLLMDDDGAKS